MPCPNITPHTSNTEILPKLRHEETCTGLVRLADHKIHAVAYDYYRTKARKLVNRFITGGTTDVDTKL